MVLVWDPGAAQSGPVGIGDHDARVEALAVLPAGRLASGGGERVADVEPSGPGGLGRA
jgi:hypothetical protein